jgi:hypothetical protein
MKSGLRHLCLLLAVLLFSLPTSAMAVNWLRLQGTEPAKSPPIRLYGNVVADYMRTSDTHLPAGPWKGQKAAANQIGPRLTSHSQFTLRKVRIGARGALPDPRFNYRITFLLGDNAVTHLDSGNRVRFVDTSLTINVIPHARLRLGVFKYPGAEEGLQFDPGPYINHSNASTQLLRERFFDSDGANPLDPNIPRLSSTYRDIGVMLFDFFRIARWEHTYAVMVGNGRGLSLDNGSPGAELYLYWSSEYVFSGKGMQQEGLKLFAWLQNGKRTIKTGAAQTELDFDRTRFGSGVAYQRGNIRATVELVKAEGIIYNGVDSGAVPGALSKTGAVSSYNLLPEEDAFGWYTELGYQVLPDWWLDVRYDRLDRGTKISSNERRFTTFTLGTHYYFNPQTRLVLDFEIRDNKAPNLADTAPPNLILGSYDNRLSLQLLWKF